jgi:hypothetical protein
VVELDYRLSQSFADGLSGDALTTADEVSLRYGAFFGDIVFRANGASFDARWGWVPVLDFALALQAIVEALATEPREAFEFTESDATISFEREDDRVRIEATYTADSAAVMYVELRTAAEGFLARVLDELAAAHPELTRNPALSTHLRKASS